MNEETLTAAKNAAVFVGRERAVEINTDDNHTVELDNIKPPPHYEDVEGPQIITSDTARQGPRGTRVLVVLVCGLAAVYIAFALVFFFGHR